MDKANTRCAPHLAVLSPDYLPPLHPPEWAAPWPGTRPRAGPADPRRVGATCDQGLLRQIVYIDLTASAEADAERLLLKRVKESGRSPATGRRSRSQRPRSRRRPQPKPEPPLSPLARPQPPARQSRLRRPRGGARGAPQAADRRRAGRHSPRPSPAWAASARPRPRCLRLPPPRRLPPRLVAPRRDPGRARRRLRHPRRAARPRPGDGRPGQAGRRGPRAPRRARRLAPRLRQRRGPAAAAGLPPARPATARAHHLPPHRLVRHRQGRLPLELMPEAEALQLLTGRPTPRRCRRRAGRGQGAGRRPRPPAARPRPGRAYIARDRPRASPATASCSGSRPRVLERGRPEPRLPGQRRQDLAGLDRRGRGRMPGGAAPARAAGLLRTGRLTRARCWVGPRRFPKGSGTRSSATTR